MWDSVLKSSKKKVHKNRFKELNHKTEISGMDFALYDLPSSAKIKISFGFVLQSVHSSDEVRCINRTMSTNLLKECFVKCFVADCKNKPV